MFLFKNTEIVKIIVQTYLHKLKKNLLFLFCLIIYYYFITLDSEIVIIFRVFYMIRKKCELYIVLV